MCGIGCRRIYLAPCEPNEPITLADNQRKVPFRDGGGGKALGPVPVWPLPLHFQGAAEYVGCIGKRAQPYVAIRSPLVGAKAANDWQSIFRWYHALETSIRSVRRPWNTCP